MKPRQKIFLQEAIVRTGRFWISFTNKKQIANVRFLKKLDLQYYVSNLTFRAYSIHDSIFLPVLRKYI